MATKATTQDQKSMESRLGKVLMRVLLNTLALIVIIGWSIVYFKYHTGGLFHLTLAVALVTLVIQWFPKSKPRTIESA